MVDVRVSSLPAQPLRFSLLACLVVVGLLASACSSPEPDVAVPLVVEVPRQPAPPRTAGFDTTTFRLGVIADLTGPEAAANRMVLAGVEAYWSTVNALGGIDGRFPVELVVRDVGGDAPAADAVRAYSELEPEVAMFALVGGTAVIDAVRELASADEILVAPSTRQSTWAQIDALLPMGAPYAAEALSGVSWMSRDDVEPVQWCATVDPSLVAQDELVGVLLAEVALDTIGPIATFDVSQLGVDAAIEGVVAGGCDRVWLANSAANANALIEALAATDVAIEVGVGSEVSLPLPADTLDWASQWLVVATDAPSWGDDATGSVVLRAAVDDYAPDVRPNPWIRFGFVSQYPVDVVLRTAAIAVDVSRPALWTTASNLTAINAGGLAGSFDRTGGLAGIPREISVHAIDLTAGDPLGLRLIERYEASVSGALDDLWVDSAG